jgi:hypothetical protein
MEVEMSSGNRLNNPYVKRPDIGKLYIHIENMIW